MGATNFIFKTPTDFNVQTDSIFGKRVLIIDREAREIMHLVASVRLSVCPSGFTQATLYTTTMVYGVLVHQENYTFLER